MKVKLDQDRCVASGQCVMAAMDVFDQRDEDGIAMLLTDEVGPEQVQDVQMAAMVCPAAAIELSE